jgi:uncharacterized protein (DUF305 family)
MATRRLATLALSGGLALTLAACGGTSSSTGASSSSGHSSSATSAPSASSSAAAHNSADVMFAEMMIPHHQQAVQMAQLAATRAANPQVKDLAAHIQAAQDPEITTMKGWLASWGEPTAMPGSSGHSAHGMSGMMGDADMTKLRSMSGKAFDREFLTMMLAHHQGAIDMAKTEQNDGRYTAAKQLAANIIRTQTEEISRMATLLKQV